MPAGSEPGGRCGYNGSGLLAAGRSVLRRNRNSPKLAAKARDAGNDYGPSQSDFGFVQEKGKEPTLRQLRKILAK